MAGGGQAAAVPARAAAWARAEASARAVQPTLCDAGQPLIDATFVALDLETTGLSPRRDRITEIGAVKVRGGELLGELRTFVHPGRPIPPAITAITGITDAMVRGAPPIGAVLPAVLRFLDGCVFVAHNARFDLSFLRVAAEAHGLGPLEPPVIDTARLSRRLLGNEVRNHRLATLAQHLRAPHRPDHRALHDARATIDVLHALFERAGSLGATTLPDLQALTRSSSDRAYRRRGLVADAPSSPGTYRFLDDRGAVLYVGKATDLRARLLTYFGRDPRRRMADMLRETASVTWQPAPTLLEAEVAELRQLHALRPRYNRRSTRPDAAAWVALTREPFPRLSVVQRPGPTHLRTLGPLPSRRAAGALCEALQLAVPVRQCTGRLRLAQDHPPCVLKDLGRCGAPCDGSQDRDGYAEVVGTLAAAFDDPTAVLEVLRTRMDAAARTGRYERAAELRTALHRTARAVAGARDRGMLDGARALYASRSNGDATEIVVLRDGRLAATARERAGCPDRLALDVARRLAGVPGEDADQPRPDVALPPLDAAVTDGAETAEEQGVLLSWLARPGVRVLWVDGTLASPVAGGAAVASAVTEALAVARHQRRDQLALDREKVRAVG